MEYNILLHTSISITLLIPDISLDNNQYVLEGYDERLNFQTACVTNTYYNTSFIWITLFTRPDACQGRKINKW